jgi:hypothetical protein
MIYPVHFAEVWAWLGVQILLQGVEQQRLRRVGKGTHSFFRN